MCSVNEFIPKACLIMKLLIPPGGSTIVFFSPIYSEMVNAYSFVHLYMNYIFHRS